MAGRRVFIVEDDPFAAEQLRTSLTADGYEVAGVVPPGEQQHKARTQEEQARPQVDESYGLLATGLPNFVIFTLDTAGRILSWNRSAERATGYSAGEIIGQSFAILFSEEDRQKRIPEEELRSAEQESWADDSNWVVGSDGRRFWADGQVTAIRDGDGVLTGFIKAARDATERKQMQDALRKSEERLQVALRAARMGTWYWNLRTNAEILDDSLLELFGLGSHDEVRTIEDFYALLHADDRPGVVAAFERTRNEGVHLDVEFRVPRRDGSERWFIDQGEVVSDGDGQPEYLTGACVDITERKNTEEELRRSEERFRLFVDHVQDYALFQLDDEGRIEIWNSGAEHVLGYTAAEIIGQASGRIFTPEDVAAGEPARELRDARRLGRVREDRWHLRKDGTRFWSSGVMTAMHDGHGRIHGFAKVMRDETERRKADEQVTASLHEKEILLKEIHHRVKNNLQVITSLLTLQANTVDDEATQDMFEEACNRVRSIGEIHELLYRSPDLARIDFGAYLHRLSHHLRSFYGVDPNRVRLKVDVNVNLPLSEAIPCGLIVNELLTNSLKHGFRGGRSGQIQVRFNCTEETCALEIADDGAGLPPDFTLQKGSSLGLKLVSVLAKQLRGELTVEGSDGTQVSVAFPRRAG